jgi:hypothetical protein
VCTSWPEATAEEEARAAWRTQRARKALARLALDESEVLAIAPRSILSFAAESSFLLVHRGSDFTALDARLDALGELFPNRAVESPPRPTPVISAVAYRIGIRRSAVAPNERPRHWFGGTLGHDLKCRNCRTPMHLLLTIDSRAPGVALPPLGRRDFRIAYCLNCMTFPGLLYVDYSKPRLRVIRQAKEERANEDEALDARTVTLTRIESATRSVSRIGGTPNWIQSPKVPECTRCRRPMAFFAQLRSMPDLGFVDDGTLYTFVCVRCKVSASLIQSH